MLPAEQKNISVFETKRGFLSGVQSRSWGECVLGQSIKFPLLIKVGNVGNKQGFPIYDQIYLS